MKKSLKISLFITIPVVVIIATVITVMALVKTTPIKELSSYSYATIYKNSTSEGYQVGANVNSDDNADFKALVEDCSYSVLQSVFSGRVDLDNEYYYDSGNEVGLKMENFLNGKGLYDASVADINVAKIKFTFSSVRTAVIGNAEYTFDTVEMLVPNTNGEIREVTAVAYTAIDFTVQDDNGNGESENEYKEYFVFKFHANTSALYAYIANLSI